METPHERLAEARRLRFASATEAAKALGIPPSTYLGHENGDRGLSRIAPRYAAFFRVSLDWLLDGRGSRKGDNARTISIIGRVGAGAEVHPIGGDTFGIGIDEIALPDIEHLGALEVDGDSQYPRYLHGEIVMYDTRPVGPAQLVNRYSVVDLTDGRRMLKMLRRVPGSGGQFWLESHNAAPMHDIEIEAAYRIKGTLER